MNDPNTTQHDHSDGGTPADLMDDRRMAYLAIAVIITFAALVIAALWGAVAWATVLLGVVTLFIGGFALAFVLALLPERKPRRRERS